MSILRRLFGLEPKKTEEPTFDLAVKQEKINEAPPRLDAAQEAPIAPATVVAEAQGQAPAELIAPPVEPVVAAVAVPVATRARKTAASTAPRAKKIKK